MIRKLAAPAAFAALLLAIVTVATRDARSQTPPSLADAYAVIASKPFADLTHTFGPPIPHCHGFSTETVRTLLDKVPESGAIAIVTFPKPQGSSGFPARVIAILP